MSEAAAVSGVEQVDEVNKYLTSLHLVISFHRQIHSPFWQLLLIPISGLESEKRPTPFDYNYAVVDNGELRGPPLHYISRPGLLCTMIDIYINKEGVF